jgi:ATP-dependent Lon protease
MSARRKPARKRVAARGPHAAKPAATRTPRAKPSRVKRAPVAPAPAAPARAKRPGARPAAHIVVPVAVRDTPVAEPAGDPPGSTAAAPVPPGMLEHPVLPVRHTVLFPLAILPLNIGREKSVKLLNDVMAGDRTVVVIAQRDGTIEEPGPADLYDIGTLGTILRMIRVAEDRFSILIQGVRRVRLAGVAGTSPYIRGRLQVLEQVEVSDVETEALSKTVVQQFERVVSLSPNVPDEAAAAARTQEGAGRVADFIASLLELPVEDKQRLLETLDVKERLRFLTALLARDLQVLEVGQQIQESVRENLDKGQREFFLRQQMEAIRKELGEGDDSQREIDELKEKIEKAQMPPEVRKEADRELSRLTRIPAQAAEYTVARTYLEWLCEMPWTVLTEDNLELKHARQVLDQDHYGLDKIKERILEFLVVRAYKKDARTPILCFAGPPGTGKTSLGQSIARALGRKFVRQSLGGVRDEAEIRGHRRTYIGALPGNIIQGIRRAASRNPVFMLDEIDKLGMDFRGDPASALLEVLDPQQNTAFVDHYLDVPFDLSSVLFITTANYLDPVPPALRDRMEVIELSGYTDHEKLEIAKRHLIPKAVRENGLESLGFSFEDEALNKIMREYTREAGLRNLEREIANVLRKSAKQVLEEKDPPRRLTPAKVRELLGPERFEDEKPSRLDTPGAVLGLAWTPSGGEVLTIEATAMPGSKSLLLTGQLGDVMKESAQAALSWVRSHTEPLGLLPDWFNTRDIHIHLPAGAIPKDGPSAGVALASALVSLATGRRARSAIAMTGEITLRGRVLKVGGIKEKVLGAHRAGIKTVILPAENHGDVEEVPVEIRTHMIFAPVERIEQVLELALEETPATGAGAGAGAAAAPAPPAARPKGAPVAAGEAPRT